MDGGGRDRYVKDEAGYEITKRGSETTEKGKGKLSKKPTDMRGKL